MGEGSPTLKEEILSQQQTKGKTGEGSLYPKGRNPLSTTNQGEDGRRFSLSWRKKSSLNNKPRRRREKVILILKEEILSQ
jgi:hypothetical protein